MQVAFTMVDELVDLRPKQEKDSYFDVVDVDIAYNESTIEYRDRRYMGSAVEKAGYVCCGLWSVHCKLYPYVYVLHPRIFCGEFYAF